MQIAEVLRQKREQVLDLARRRGASNVRVFGSVARGEAGPSSDVDLLIDMDAGRTLLDLGGLALDLEELLGRRVDLVTERGLHPYVRERVLAEARAL